MDPISAGLGFLILAVIVGVGLLISPAVAVIAFVAVVLVAVAGSAIVGEGGG